MDSICDLPFPRGLFALVLGLLFGCSQQDPQLLQQTAIKQERIQFLQKDLADLQAQPIHNLTALAQRLDQETEAVQQVHRKVTALHSPLEDAQARLSTLQAVKGGYDQVTFNSGLEVVGRVKNYAQGKLEIEDGSGTVKSGSPAAVRSIVFRREEATPSDFPKPRARPTPAPRLPMPAANAPARLELDLVKRTLSDSQGLYSGYKDQEVSFTIRITSREPLKDWAGLKMSVWIIARDIRRKTQHQNVIHESATFNIERGQTVEHNTEKVLLEYYDSRYSNAYDSGFKYYGYVIKLYDDQGKEVMCNASHSKLEREFNQIKEHPTGEIYEL